MGVYWDNVSFIYLQTAGKVCDSVRKEVLYNILSEFGIDKKLVQLIKMCLNETCSKACIDKTL
jgi:hypothetical protein